MADWLSSMQQTFEYYVVDPVSWEDMRRLDTVTKSTIVRDSESDTLGNATFNITGVVDECYIRAYLVTIQNGVTERHCLGTFLVQTPSSSFDGRVESATLDAYTPLIELKENYPPIGYSLFKGDNIMEYAYKLTSENVRVPVVSAICSTSLEYDFVADMSDTWSTYISDLMSNAEYEFGLDEKNRILFLPKQDTAALQAVWTYDDSNSSILYPDITMNRDLYGIPNVVEVIYSNGGRYYYARAVNDDPNSPISTVNRGREILYRDTNPSLVGNSTQDMVQEYAERLLREMSTLEYTLTYTHGYCPVRIGDCVRLNYARAGLNNVKARVVRQSISCQPGCPVTEKAVFTTKLWG